MTKEQSVLSKIMKVLSNEKIILQRYVLNKCRIELYFLEHRLAIEVDESNVVDSINDNEEKKK